MNSFVQFLKTNVVENIKSDVHMKARSLGTGDKSAIASRSQSQYPLPITHAKKIDIFRKGT